MSNRAMVTDAGAFIDTASRQDGAELGSAYGRYADVPFDFVCRG